MLGPRKIFMKRGNDWERMKRVFTDSYATAKITDHERIIKNLHNTIASGDSPKARASLLGRYGKLITWHQEMMDAKKNGKVYTKSTTRGMIGEMTEYKSGPAELSDATIKKKRTEFASWDRKKHLKQAKEHDEGVKHWFKNGVDSVAAHKQLLWAKFHRDEAKRKTTPLGNLARMVGLAESVEVLDNGVKIANYNNFPEAERHAIEASKKTFGNHATGGRTIHVKHDQGKGRVSTHSYFAGQPVATVVKVNGKVTGQGKMHRTLSMPILGKHHGERHIAENTKYGVRNVYETYADIYAKDVLGIENLDEVQDWIKSSPKRKRSVNVSMRRKLKTNDNDESHKRIMKAGERMDSDFFDQRRRNENMRIATNNAVKFAQKNLKENYVEHNGDVYRIDKVAHKKFTFTLKRNGVKEPLIKTYDNIHDARNAMTMAMRNINSKQNVTESSKDYHLGVFREHVLRYKRAINSKDFFSAAQHKMNAIEYWRAYIGGKNSNPPPEELQEDYENKGKILRILLRKKGYGRDRADWALPPSSDNDIKLDTPDDRIIPFKK